MHSFGGNYIEQTTDFSVVTEQLVKLSDVPWQLLLLLLLRRRRRNCNFMS